MKTAKAWLHLIVWMVILIIGYPILVPIAAELPWTAALIGIGFITGAILISRFINDSVKNAFDVFVVCSISVAILLTGGITAYFIDKSEDPVIQSFVAVCLLIFSFIGIGKTLNIVRKPRKI